MWPLFAFISAFFESGKDIIGKNVSTKTNEYATAFAIQLFGAITLLPFLLYTGIPHIDQRFWLILLGFCFTIPSANILYMRAIKLSPLSVAVPMLAFNPVITAILAIFFDNKYPSLLGWTGVALISIGIYCVRLNRQKTRKGIEPGALAMLGVAAIWAVGAHLSHAAVQYSNALFASWIGAVVAAIILFLFTKRNGHINLEMIKKNIKMFASIGVLDGLSNLAMYTALSSGLTAYVVSIKRTNILWSSLVGKFYLHEEVSKTKLLGIFLMLVGIISILL